jgi:hypothetical protein
VFSLPRSDSALCFAHNTAFAYPIIQQVRTAVEVYGKARSRAMDLGAMRGHILRVMNGMLPFLHDAPKGMSGSEDLDTVFILGGFSWIANDFKTWTYRFNRESKRFVHATPRGWRGRIFTFAGDEIVEAKRRLFSLMKARGKTDAGGFDMEPLEVIRDMIVDGSYPSIGGPPQLLKVYRHMNVMPYAIAWPTITDGLTLMGRPLLEYEATTFLVLDPQTLQTLTYERYCAGMPPAVRAKVSL